MTFRDARLFLLILSASFGTDSQEALLKELLDTIKGHFVKGCRDNTKFGDGRKKMLYRCEVEFKMNAPDFVDCFHIVPFIYGWGSALINRS